MILASFAVLDEMRLAALHMRTVLYYLLHTKQLTVRGLPYNYEKRVLLRIYSHDLPHDMSILTIFCFFPVYLSNFSVWQCTRRVFELLFVGRDLLRHYYIPYGSYILQNDILVTLLCWNNICIQRNNRHDVFNMLHCTARVTYVTVLLPTSKI